MNISTHAKVCTLKNFKDTHREKAPSNEIPALVESINMEVTGKTPFFVVDSFYTPHSICLFIDFCKGGFLWKWWVFNLSLKDFAFQKICLEVTALKTFKISNDVA